MGKKTLDNMTGQEIKEMISDEIVTLEELDVTSLEKVLSFETDMLCFGNGDMDIIRKCSELLDAASNDQLLSDEDFAKIIEKTKSEQVTVVSDETKHYNVPKARIILKRAVLVAAAISILMTSTIGIASAFGFDIWKCLSEIVRNSEGTENNIDEFTFYHNGEAKEYSAIEEMIESENLDIMYPGKLPPGVEITRISKHMSERETELIKITTNDSNILINAEINGPYLDANSPDCKIYERNGITYFIFEEESCFAVCNHNNIYYSINANTYDELIYIIDNLKE